MAAEQTTVRAIVRELDADSALVEVEQGSCLMEFFHNRWRRANDVRRWDDKMNTVAGCAYVFSEK